MNIFRSTCNLSGISIQELGSKWECTCISDTPFSGSLDDFKTKETDTYKSWFQVKDDGSIPPYIATSRDWNNNCQSNYRGKSMTFFTLSPFKIQTCN